MAHELGFLEKILHIQMFHKPRQRICYFHLYHQPEQTQILVHKTNITQHPQPSHLCVRLLNGLHVGYHVALN